MILPPDGVPDTVATATKWQTWSLDIQGNWDSVTTSLDGTSSTTQTRTHNKQNQATVVGGANLAYDNNGALTTDETGKTLIYDAWGRLVQVKQGMTVLATYRYDALNRRVTEANGTSKDFYYSDRMRLRPVVA